MTVIGIDFGNKNICISKINNGKIEIISNLAGKKNILNIITFNSTRLYDNDALNVISQNNNANLTNIHNLLSSNLDYNKYQTVCKYEEPYYQIEFMKEIYKIRKEHIMVMLFNYITKISGEFNECVISIPSFMNNYEKKIIMNAAEIVNINILGFINNSISAAVNYNFFNFKKITENDEQKSENTDKISNTGVINKDSINKNNNKYYIFLNIGENHTSFAAIHMKKNWINILHQTCSKDISGKKIDLALMEHFSEQFFQKHKIDITQNYKTIFKLKKECEKIKQVLSINKKYKSKVEYFYKEIDFEFSISREEYDNLILNISNNLNKLLQKSIENINIEKNSFDSIELIGGSCRIPLLVNSIKQLQIPVRTSLNLDESVSKGCCLLGAMISNYIQTSNNIEILYPEKKLSYQIDNEEITYSENNNIIKFITNKEQFVLFVYLDDLKTKLNFSQMNNYNLIKSISVSILLEKDLQMIQVEKVVIETDKELIDITKTIINSEKNQTIATEIKNVEYNICELESIVEKKYKLQNEIETTYFYLEEKKCNYSFLISKQNLEIIDQMNNTIDELYDINNINTYEDINNQLTNIKENLEYRIYEYENIDAFLDKLRKTIELCLKDIEKRKYLNSMKPFLNDILCWANKKTENKQENMKNSSFTTSIIQKKINDIKQKRKEIYNTHKKLLKEIKHNKQNQPGPPVPVET